MNKKLLIIFIVVFLIAGATAISFKDFKTGNKVLKISTKKICEAEILKSVSKKFCHKNTPKEIDVNNKVAIIKDKKSNVIMITNPNNIKKLNPQPIP